MKIIEQRKCSSAMETLWDLQASEMHSKLNQYLTQFYHSKIFQLNSLKILIWCLCINSKFKKWSMISIPNLKIMSCHERYVLRSQKCNMMLLSLLHFPLQKTISNWFLLHFWASFAVRFFLYIFSYLWTFHNFDGFSHK